MVHAVSERNKQQHQTAVGRDNSGAGREFEREKAQRFFYSFIVSPLSPPQSAFFLCAPALRKKCGEDEHQQRQQPFVSARRAVQREGEKPEHRGRQEVEASRSTKRKCQDDTCFASSEIASTLLFPLQASSERFTSNTTPCRESRER